MVDDGQCEILAPARTKRSDAVDRSPRSRTLDKAHTGSNRISANWILYPGSDVYHHDARGAKGITAIGGERLPRTTMLLCLSSCSFGDSVSSVGEPVLVALGKVGVVSQSSFES